MYHLLGKELGSPILSPPTKLNVGRVSKDSASFCRFENANSPLATMVFTVSEGIVFGEVKKIKKYHTNFPKIHIVKAIWKKCFWA